MIEPVAGTTSLKYPLHPNDTAYSLFGRLFPRSISAGSSRVKFSQIPYEKKVACDRPMNWDCKMSTGGKAATARTVENVVD